MRFSRLFTLFNLLSWMVCQPGFADIDPAEYEFKSAVDSEKERKRLTADFEVDRKREAELRQQQVAEAAQKLAAAKATWDALPYAVRLTQQRCTRCHLADQYVKQGHNRVGWELVVLRMQYLNNMVLGPGERGQIAAHLAETYPAKGATGAMEGLQQLGVLFSPLWLWLAWKAARSRWGR